MLDLLARKRRGESHPPEELRFIAQGAADGSLPDYQLSAWLMAVCLRGMAPAESLELTRAMAESGAKLDLSGLTAPKVDKHSTGGVGDGVSLALAPLAAAAGLAVPMMSGRGLGHTGGTLDKLESVPGLKVRLPLRDVAREMAQVGASFFGQSEELAPADRKLYHLRDATSTVESMPLVTASILSKKLAEDLDALVLDVKVGSGAIFPDLASARSAAKMLVGTAKRLGLKTAALLTAMDQPLGRAVGNALEMRQAIEVLHGDKRPGDFIECLLALGGWMLHLGGLARRPEEGQRKLEPLLSNGAALAKLKEMIAFQGGDAGVADDPARLACAPLSRAVASPSAGYVSRMDARQVGEAAVVLGAGRERQDQALDYGAGIVIEKKVGDKVRPGDAVACLYASDPAKLEEACGKFRQALAFSPRPSKRGPIIKEVIR